ncbi:ABC transporter permease [Turicimonas muris]|uniref:Multidrug ABC transporter substrate-binding protein n=7 Tax=Turicimonas muris TaxID=1796652 RepID=A0A227KDZ1_9BURK|nr:ABC transporter permease [Turicimonas muris]ANU66515.1 multidrug ABC transporter substrate-binding protein [Burkholderiales bacterium YL45]OXE45646.1 multidrug ABC transporter substrate-binding protein [Turicimonas muris]QQQ97662.1 ABC transporter permease [Turicimonas muris]
MIGNALLLALRQIFRNPLRSMLTVLGIVIGVAAVITMVTVGNGATQQVRDQIASLGSDTLMIRPGQRMGPGQSIGAPSFKEADAEAISQQIAGIRAVAPSRSNSTVVVANGKNWLTTVVGSTNSYFDVNNLTLKEGRFFEPAEVRAGSAVCVIGQTLQKELFDNQSVLGKLVRIKGFSCQVVGLLDAKGQSGFGQDKDDIVIIPLNTFQRRLSGNVRVPLITVAIEPQSDIERVKEGVRLLLRERRSLSSGDADNFNVLDTSELIETISKTSQVMTMLLGAVAAVSLLVGGIGIMNIMLVSVTERTREIGVRLAIGAMEREVLLQFLIESIMLACLGGLIGIVLALVASIALTSYMQVPFVFSPAINLLAFGFAAFIGVLFGYFPARRAAKLDPIEAVRHE